MLNCMTLFKNSILCSFMLKLLMINDLLYETTHGRTLAVSQAKSLWVVMIAKLKQRFQNVNF